MEKSKVNIDSLILAHDAALKDMLKTTDSLKRKKKLNDIEIDSTLSDLINNTNIQVTDGTITEALLWIEDYNDSLQ